MMGKLHKNEQGFGAIEAILIVAVVVLLGVVGYMVYKNHNKTTTTPTTANSITSTTPAKATTSTATPAPPATSYFTIKEWGVRAPYTGQDSFTYTLSDSDKLATVISKQLAAKDTGCTAYGAGQISRLAPSDGSYEGGDEPSVEQTAKQNPSNYTYVNGYYYQFRHDQGECGNISVIDQNQANDAVKALVASFQAVPN